MLESLLYHLCVFFRDNRIEYGWIEAIHKNKLIVVPQKGKNQFLPENRIAFSWRGEKLAYNANQAHELLEQHLKTSFHFMKKLELETIHSLLDEVREYTIDEIAADFLDDPKDSVCKLGLFVALREDVFWFKHNRNLTYTPRTADELEVLRIQLARQKERQERADSIQEWIKQLESGEWNEKSERTADQQLWLDQLLDILIKGAESQNWKEMSSHLEWGATIGYDEEKMLKNWFEKAGSAVSPSRLTLLRADIQKKFSEEILSEAESVRYLPLSAVDRISEKIPTFTIDAEKTQDYDDAFSVIECSEDKLEIAIHITDLSSFVTPGDKLFEEAEERISSVYTIEESVPMFPESLSNDTFSLKAGEERNVFSYNFSISQNGTWKLTNVVRQIVRVWENLSYEHADQLIHEDRDFWGLLHKFCQLAQEKRMENGALNMARKEFEFDISNPEQVSILKLNRNSPSSRIIEELAIAVNRETGRLFHEAEFPGIYRTQSSYKIVKEPEYENQQLPENIRVEPARLTTIAGTHAGLGCEVYMHATSPIRRFVDLLTQHQLNNLINDEEPVYSSEDMMRWAEAITLRQRKYNRAEKNILQYWKFKYLHQHMKELFEATVRKQLSNNNTEIELVELDFIAQVSGLRGHNEEEQIVLRINEVRLDPLKLVVRGFKSCPEGESLHRLDSVD